MSDYHSCKSPKASRRQILAGLLASPFSLSVISHSRAEPLTFTALAAFVGLNLLKGAISYVGGRLLAEVLGQPTITDVRLWIGAAVDELKGFISEELRTSLTASAIDKMRLELSGIRENFYHYASLSPENRHNYRFLLEHSSVHTSRLVHGSVQHDQAFFVTTTAVAYRLFVLRTFFIVDKDKGHIRSAQSMVDNVLRQLSMSRDRIAKEMSPWGRYGFSCDSKNMSKSGGVYKDWQMEEPNGGRRMLFTCHGTDRGHQITDTYSAVFSAYEENLADLEMGRVQDHVRESLGPFTEPLQRRHDEFLSLANSSLHRIYTCYHEMCHEAGFQYDYPEDIGPIPPDTVAAVPSVVKMPGAIVREATK